MFTPFVLMLALPAFSSPPAPVLADSLAPAAQTSICPLDDARSRANVDRFMTSSAFAAERQRLGIDGLSPATVRVLSDSTDGAACRALNEAITLGARPYPRLKMYYTVGSYYLVATITVVPADRIYLGFEPLLVLDKGTLRPVTSLAM